MSESLNPEDFARATKQAQESTDWVEVDPNATDVIPGPQIAAQPSSPVVDPEDVERLARLFEDHLSTGLGCRCGWKMNPAHRMLRGVTDPRGQHRVHVAEEVAEFIAEVRREAAERGWDEGRATGDCECGHSIVAHPSDDYRRCRVSTCECTYYAQPTNPYRREEKTDAT